MQNSFIGTIAWFSSKKLVPSGWFALRKQSYLLELPDGSEIKIPSLRDGDFIRHNLINPEQQQSAAVGLHNHKFKIGDKHSAKKNATLVDSVEGGASGSNVVHAGSLTTISSSTGGDILAFEKKITVNSSYDYGLSLVAEGETNENNGENETRPQNTSLIAHIYVGLGWKPEIN